MGSWNILSFSDDHRLPHLSDELGRLRVAIAGLAEVRSLGNDETSSKGYTYYWFGMSNGSCLRRSSYSYLQQAATVDSGGFSSS